MLAKLATPHVLAQNPGFPRLGLWAWDLPPTSTTSTPGETWVGVHHHTTTETERATQEPRTAHPTDQTQTTKLENTATQAASFTKVEDVMFALCC